jgi:aspartate aminotransferase
LKPSATLSLNDRVREMWGAGLDVYHLGFGESRFPVHPKIAEALRANVHQRSYLPAMGIWELRETIAGFYHRKFRMEVSPDQVVTGPGSKSLLYALVLALGEELILPQPSWVSYASQAHMVGKPVNWVPMRPDRDYVLDIGDLRQVMEDSRDNWGNPEVLVLNSPNNPTGTMLSPDAVQALAEFAREQRLMVLSDEIYALTAHCQVPHVSPAQHYPEGTVALGGLSKHLSLGGWRFGLAILPPGRAGAICGPGCLQRRPRCGRLYRSVHAHAQHTHPLSVPGTGRGWGPLRGAQRGVLRFPLLRPMERPAGGARRSHIR